jgi:hypothetical protein
MTEWADSLNIENFSNAYRNWLMDKMGGEDYRILFDILYDTRFYWVLPRDSNRADKGRYLRVTFSNESGLEYEEEFSEWPCSMLEMLVGLAFSIETIMYDPDEGDRSQEWFWMMVGNLGLDIFDDRTILENGSAALSFIDDTCRTFMDRSYCFNGIGGLFPLPNTNEDQRKVELWYQANAYLENCM